VPSGRAYVNIGEKGRNSVNTWCINEDAMNLTDTQCIKKDEGKRQHKLDGHRYVENIDQDLSEIRIDDDRNMVIGVSMKKSLTC